MKKFITAVLLVLMLAAMMLFAAGCGSEDADSAARIAELEKENSLLKSQIESLKEQLGEDAPVLALQGWDLEAKPWTDGNGAAVTFTAVPVSYTEGLRAALSVRMGDLEAESTNCNWDGKAFTGSVDLAATDGYSYYCILTDVAGSQAEILLNSPDSMTDEALVNLGSNLTAYANLIVEDWESTASALKIKSGYIQAQMPRLTADGSEATASAAALVLKLNGQETDRREVTLTAGEGENSYETAVTDQSFTMPAMEEDFMLDLWLEVTLSTGNVICVSGGSWYYTDGSLQLVVG